MKKKWWIIPAVCAVLLLTVLFLLPEQSSEADEDAETAITETETTVSTPEIPDIPRPGMAKKEVESILGTAKEVSDDYLQWNYDALSVTFHGFNEQVSEIRAMTGSDFTLDSGIGPGSTREAVLEAYPTAYETTGKADSDVDTWIYFDNPEDGYQIGIVDGTVSVIIWRDFSNPLLDALSVGEMDLYVPGSNAVHATGKAAKRISTILTISDPEEAPEPEGSPVGWIDLRNGAAVCLYENDYAVVFRYDGVFDPETAEIANIQLKGLFFSLSEAFAQALENPTETW